ncbi:MAG: hypothetical protein Q8Q56_05500, partial [Alphaproteobacteria bacterium]|nr:hypothetical protein [Alphaproteobacteria bacterium]
MKDSRRLTSLRTMVCVGLLLQGSSLSFGAGLEERLSERDDSSEGLQSYAVSGKGRVARSQEGWSLRRMAKTLGTAALYASGSALSGTQQAMGEFGGQSGSAVAPFLLGTMVLTLPSYVGGEHLSCEEAPASLEPSALLTCASFQGLSLTYGAAAAGGDGGAYSSDEEAFSRGGAALSSSSVREISAKIHEYAPLAEAVRGKDITVFVGNTGSGKSTTLNILAGNALVTNRFGDIELAPGASGLPVGAGGTSVTAYPQSIQLPTLGMLFDMPGFEDTEGAVKDLLNAGLMKAILERAGTVKVALIVSQAEFEAVRTKGLRDVMKHIRLFPPEFLESSLSILLTKAT